MSNRRFKKGEYVMYSGGWGAMQPVMMQIVGFEIDQESRRTVVALRKPNSYDNMGEAWGYLHQISKIKR